MSAVDSPAAITEKIGMDRARIIDWLRRRGPGLALDLAVNIAIPVLVYDRTHAHWGEVNALLAASAAPVLWSLGVFLRDRRIDAISLMALAGIALSMLAVFGGGGAQFLLLREKMVTLVIAIAFLGSAAIGKPLIYPLARATVARESTEALAAFEARRDHPLLKRTMMVMTLAWGFGLLADFLVSVLLIYTIPHEAYLAVGPILGYGAIGGLTLWTILYRRSQTRLGAKLRAEAEAR